MMEFGCSRRRFPMGPRHCNEECRELIPANCKGVMLGDRGRICDPKEFPMKSSRNA